MLCEYIAPPLRTLGFGRGLSPGAFRHETATHDCEVRFRKSRGSTPRYVDFWAGRHASDLNTEFVYWGWQLHSLAPGPLIGWTLEAGQPAGPVASEVLRIFYSYGWPARRRSEEDHRAISQGGLPGDRYRSAVHSTCNRTPGAAPSGCAGCW
jgi:hypothetical protein